MSWGPTDDDVLLSVFRNKRLGSMHGDINVVTYAHLLEVLQHTRARPHVETSLRNLIYTWKVIGWYPRTRWLAAPSRCFRWTTVLSDDESPPVTPSRNRWRLLCDYRPGMELSERDIVIPYGVSPSLIHSGVWADKDSLRKTEATTRIMFAGSCSAPMYDKKHIISGRFGKLTRKEVVDCLRRSGLFRDLTAPPDWKGIRRDRCPVLIDTARYRVPVLDWLPTVASADFFVCPPGCIMPPSHNIVEAMGVGTIPLTNYPEWFFPPLQDGVNCVTFGDEASLDRKLRLLLAMPASRIADMKGACIDYYDRYLDPRVTAARLDACPPGEIRLHVLDETTGNLGLGPRSGAEAAGGSAARAGGEGA